MGHSFQFVTNTLKHCGQSGIEMLGLSLHTTYILQRLSRTLFKPSLYSVTRQICPNAENHEILILGKFSSRLRKKKMNIWTGCKTFLSTQVCALLKFPVSRKRNVCCLCTCYKFRPTSFHQAHLNL
jgi:hypothetical protein